MALTSTDLNFDLSKPTFPIIKIPKWLQPEIKQVLLDFLDHLKYLKKLRSHENFDRYAYFVHIFNTVKKVFTVISMKPVWEKLVSISKEAAENFALILFLGIQNKYDHALDLIEKHKNEIKSCEKVIVFAQKLVDQMESYQHLFFGHMLQDNHDDITDTLKNFIQNTAASLNEFKNTEAVTSSNIYRLYPMTRQSRDKNSLAIFYMRSIYLFFKESFKKPMYEIIADIVNTIFNTKYTETDAVKYCATRQPKHRQLIKK